MIKRLPGFLLLGIFLPVILGFDGGKKITLSSIHFPYQRAGLTQEEAAAHLLNRFTYGPRPGQVQEVLKTGLEQWFLSQLNAEEDDKNLMTKLRQLDAVGLTNQEIVKQYPDPGMVLKMAVDGGVITREEAAEMKSGDRKAYRDKMLRYMASKGIKPRAELNRQLVNQKIWRAVYSNNQLQEMMTAFWFNHFNVSLTKNQAAPFVLSYERDVIRPNAIGNFETLLLATAKAPAMLEFLDNARSMVSKTEISQRQMMQQKLIDDAIEKQQLSNPSMQQADLVNRVKQARQNQGLNENYAREIMELHTLGVDGGYTQKDVTEAARVLTGWTIYPFDGTARLAVNNITNRFTEAQLEKRGFVHEGDFLFASNRHDFNEKHFLGQTFPSGNGYEEGLRLIHTLATHNATAHFICKKIAVRFVSDEPSETLINEMAETFLTTNGDIKSVLICMVNSDEFWSKDVLRSKIKSPFELIVSAVRALDGEVSRPYTLYQWSAKMGEDLYRYQAPTGFPDRGPYWINTSSLLNRINFGLAVSNKQVNGTDYNIEKITKNREPESVEAALKTYGTLLMPCRNLDETVSRLLPLITDEQFQQNVADAAEKQDNTDRTMRQADPDDFAADDDELMNKKKTQPNRQNGESNIQMQAIGMLLGSPEFQRK